MQLLGILRGISRPALPLLLSLAVVSCIERSNPFDPLNALSPVPDIRRGYTPGLDAITQSGAGFAAGLEGYRTAFRQDSLANAGRETTNQGRKLENDRRIAANLIAAQLYPDSLLMQQELLLLDYLLDYGPYGNLQADYDSLQAAALRIVRYMEQANARHVPTVIYPAAYQDSVLGPYRRDVAAFDTLLKGIGDGKGAVTAANESIGEYNRTIRDANDSIGTFNSQVAFLKGARPGRIITLSDSLTTATVAAAPGDTLWLDSGAFTVDLRFASGTAEKPIVIRGFPGRQTILRPRDPSVPQAGIIEQSHIHFMDLVFRGGSTSGIKLNDSSRGVVFRRCLFDSNGVWGVDAAGSDLVMKDCEVRENGAGDKGGGIRAETNSCADCRLDLDNVLVVRNRGVGIEAVSPRGTITQSTISDNLSDGLQIVSTKRDLAISNSILTGNGGFGLYRDPTFENQDGLTMKVYDVWNNAGGDWSLVNLDSSRARALKEGNLDVDPGFSDPQAFDYNPRPGSRISDFELTAPFVIIGYRRKP